MNKNGFLLFTSSKSSPRKKLKLAKKERKARLSFLVLPLSRVTSAQRSPHKRHLLQEK